MADGNLGSSISSDILPPHRRFASRARVEQQQQDGEDGHDDNNNGVSVRPNRVIDEIIYSPPRPPRSTIRVALVYTSSGWPGGGCAGDGGVDRRNS